jgi:hypothetical protein
MLNAKTIDAPLFFCPNSRGVGFMKSDAHKRIARKEIMLCVFSVF